MVTKVIHEITEVELPSYNASHGWTSDGQRFRFLTNFNNYEKSIYEEAIRTFTGQGHFGITNEAYGFDEDEGRHWKLYDYWALYARDYGDSAGEIFNHFDAVRKLALKDCV
jgi:hypothetical protein